MLNIELPIRFLVYFKLARHNAVCICICRILRTQSRMIFFFQNGVYNSVWYTHFIEKEEKKERVELKWLQWCCIFLSGAVTQDWNALLASFTSFASNRLTVADNLSVNKKYQLVKLTWIYFDTVRRNFHNYYMFPFVILQVNKKTLVKINYTRWKGISSSNLFIVWSFGYIF